MQEKGGRDGARKVVEEQDGTRKVREEQDDDREDYFFKAQDERDERPSASVKEERHHGGRRSDVPHYKRHWEV